MEQKPWFNFKIKLKKCCIKREKRSIFASAKTTKDLKVSFENKQWRNGRVVECGSLENY